MEVELVLFIIIRSDLLDFEFRGYVILGFLGLEDLVLDGMFLLGYILSVLLNIKLFLLFGRFEVFMLVDE